MRERNRRTTPNGSAAFWIGRLAAALCLTAPFGAGAESAAGAPVAQPTTAAPTCAISGSAGVLANGLGMLRLGDVAGCPGLRYEIVPGLLIDGQPAVRLLPSADCAPSGSNDVLINGASAARTGDAC